MIFKNKLPEKALSIAANKKSFSESEAANLKDYITSLDWVTVVEDREWYNWSEGGKFWYDLLCLKKKSEGIKSFLNHIKIYEPGGNDTFLDKDFSGKISNFYYEGLKRRKKKL